MQVIVIKWFKRPVGQLDSRFRVVAFNRIDPILGSLASHG